MKQNAVVLGGSVAGLLAAAALAPRYDSIDIIERDVLPEGPEARRGAPQGRHVHAMLPRGLQAMERLLPGITDRLVAAGGLRGDVLGHARWYLNGLMLRQSDLGLTAVTASRPLIEHTIRAAVRELPNVTISDGYDIVGLSPKHNVHITSRHGGGSRVVPGSLVVDATGRGSRMPQWLEAFGCPPPEQEVVPIDVRYSSRIFEGDLLGDDLVVITARYPGRKRSSVMQCLEGNRVLVTLAGVHGERPPTDLEGFAEYAGSLAVPDTAKVIAAGTPVGEAVPYHFPAYVRRRYERRELPPGLLVIGDAACAFNPVYGQGMSTAAMSAELLLDDVDPQHFHAAQAQLHEAPWTLAVGADLALDATDGSATTEGPAAMVRRLQLAAVEDAELAAAFIRVTSLVDSPRALAEPWIAERLQQVRGG
ncbi:NAD(P)/FAD-dependent oxidoreductase [Dactylosporangium sp. NPDC051541]|uniref:NAD(P)/FAD-dependent oxidoreductase n=1 Tax=Dactylosporangium sp. NPDC051541 TaxID=3363977 RepID=UPI00378CC74D